MRDSGLKGQRLWGTQGISEEVSRSTPAVGWPSPEAAVAQGTGIVAVGSPFGALSPYHFEAAVFSGSVANCVKQVRAHCMLCDVHHT